MSPSAPCPSTGDTPSQPAAKRVRALLMIEQCNPEWASVPLVGYNFFKHISRLADVTLVTHQRNEAAIRKLHPDATIYFITQSAMMTNWYPIAARMSTISGKTIWPLFHTLSYPIYAEFNRRVAKLFSTRVLNGEFDIVHALTPMMPRYPIALHQACRDVPFLIGPVNGGVKHPDGFSETAKAEYSHLNFLRKLGSVLIPQYRATYEAADCVLSGSVYTKAMLEELFPSIGPVQIMAENGVDEHFFAPPKVGRNVGKPDPAVIELLFVGRLVPYKGADMAIEALGRLPEAIRNRTRLTIVGDGSERPALEVSAAKLGLRSQVKFAGWVTHEETLRYYQTADIFCFPSVREFGGAVVLEAMANRLPCIVVNNGGLGEYVTDSTGIKIEPISRSHVVDELTKHLLSLISDPSKREKMGEAAKDRALEYLWPRKAATIVEIYEKLIGQRQHKARHENIGGAFAAIARPHTSVEKSREGAR
jgi:glycosyltransferase involved in cell wall biosynthesis